MVTGMCKNCSHWSSTDSMWGECTRIVSDYPAGGEKRASINLHTDDGEADLWTQYDFGCCEWSSARAVLKRIEAAHPSPSGTGGKTASGDE